MQATRKESVASAMSVTRVEELPDAILQRADEKLLGFADLWWLFGWFWNVGIVSRGFKTLLQDSKRPRGWENFAVTFVAKWRWSWKWQCPPWCERLAMAGGLGCGGWSCATSEPTSKKVFVLSQKAFNRSCRPKEPRPSGSWAWPTSGGASRVAKKVERCRRGPSGGCGANAPKLSNTH